ncbi:MAG: glycosyltransferase family 2 protein, partial [Halioglobus sp.]
LGIIDLSRNFGKEAAMSAGIDHASGDAVVVIDADLQDPPEQIAQLVDRWLDGYDVVYATRDSRDGETSAKRWTAHAFYRLMSRIGEVQIPPDTGDFRLLSRRAVDALRQLPETQRFMKGLFTWIGFSQTSIHFRREERQAGTTSWNYWKLWTHAIEGITSFSIAPLRLAVYIGLIVSISALVYGGVVIVDTLIYGNDVKGYPSLMVAILMLGGVQLITVGILGEYLGRSFMENKRRPLYFINHFQPPEQHPAPPAD